MSTSIGKKTNTSTGNPEKIIHQTGLIEHGEAESLLSPGELALLEACTLPQEVRDHSQETAVNIQTVIEQQFPNPMDQAVVGTYVNYAWWLRFAEFGDELPVGMVLAPQKYGNGVEPEFASEFMQHRLRSIEHKVDPLIEPVFEDIDTYFRIANNDSIQGAFEQIIKEHPVYGFFTALASHGSNYEDLPITESWKRVREGQEEARVREIYGLDTSVSLRTHYNAHSVLQRAVGQIDNETMLRKSEKEDPFVRIEDWFMAEVNHPDRGYAAYVGDKHGKVVKVEGSFDEFGHFEIIPTCEDGHQDSHFIDYLFYYWNGHFTEAVFGDLTPIQEMAHVDRLAGDFMYQYYLEKAQRTQNFIRDAKDVREPDQLLAQAVTNASKTLHTQPKQSILNHKDVLVALRRPQHTPVLGAARDYVSEIWSPSVMAFHIEDTTITSRAEYWAKNHRLVARVERRTPDTASRLIMTEYSPTDIPEYDESYDMRITVKDNESSIAKLGKDKALLLPGYQATAYDPNTNTWYFKKVEHDPYRGAETVLIDGVDTEGLAGALRSIGLDAMAEVIESSTNLSLKELEQLVATNSNYSFDTSLPAITAYTSDGIDQFKELVRDGRLQVQCDGANAFLHTLIRQYTKDKALMPLSGYVLGQGKKVSAVQHAQVGYTHKGKLYILDATPATNVRIRQTRTATEASIQQMTPEANPKLSLAIRIAASFAVMSALQTPRLSQHRRSSKRKEPAVQSSKGLEANSTTAAFYDGPKAETGNQFIHLAENAIAGELPEDVLDSAMYFEEQETARQAKLISDMEQVLRGYFALSSKVDSSEVYTHVAALDGGVDPLRRTVEVIMRSKKGAINPLDPGELEAAKRYISTLQQTNIRELRTHNIPVYEPALLAVFQNLLSEIK